ncbi:MAG: GTP cyclohydrolase I [Ktedonobacterales bacterium]
MAIELDRNTNAVHDALELRRRRISDEQMRTFEDYAAEIFTAMGLDLHTAATATTPQRFIKALFDATSGYDGDAKLMAIFDAEDRDEAESQTNQVIEGPIPFYALCEHHALPFYGRAYVGYIANDHIIGISKVTRLVRLFARRFTVQERVVQQIAEALEAMLAPQGVAVYLEAHHLCTQMRGVNESSPMTRTTAWRGEFAENPALRAEFFQLCGLKGS